MKQSIIFLFWFSTFLYAQNSDLIFQNISSAEGLPTNEIPAIFQDHLGFLWFGTDNGLVQYDGYKFEIYQPDDNDPFSISGTEAGQISEDNNGNLWVLIKDDGRINKFNRKTRKFTHFTHDPGDSSGLSNKGFFHFYLDSAGDLWTVTTEDKLDKINTETGAITHYHDKRNNISSLSSDIVYAYVVGQIRRSALYEDSKGMMWIGTRGGGLYRYHRESDSFNNYRHDPSDPYSISSDNVSSIFEDSQKDIWICTRGGGLNSYSRETNRFTHYRHRSDDPLSIGSNYCIEILESKSNNLWIALENGFIVLKRILEYSHIIIEMIQKIPTVQGEVTDFYLYMKTKQVSYGYWCKVSMTKSTDMIHKQEDQSIINRIIMIRKRSEDIVLLHSLKIIPEHFG